MRSSDLFQEKLAGNWRWRPRSAGLFIAGLVLVVLVLNFGPWAGSMGYEQAEAGIVELVNASFAAAFDGQPMPEPIGPQSRVCSDRPEERYPNYFFHFPVAQLKGDPDDFVERVEAFWRSQDIEVQPGNTSGINDVFGRTKEGFRLQVFVSEHNQMAHLSGSGPCAGLAPGQG